MEPLTFVVDKFKDFGKASHSFIDGFLHRSEKSSRRNPIEILKRLQREAFLDLMKLRDRQDKVERVVSFYTPRKGSPFQEFGTRVRGEVDLLGALLMIDNVDQCSCDELVRAGIRTGINSRLTFETAVRENDTLVTEFMANQNDKGDTMDFSGVPLSLAKVFYRASVNDWMSAVAIPLGAQCRDVAITTNPSLQSKGLTKVSSFEPPILSQLNGSAIGLTVRHSNVIASLAQFVSGYGGIRQCLGTFGQIAFQFPKGTRLSLLGLLQLPRSSPPNPNTHLGALTIPIFSQIQGNTPFDPELQETRYRESMALVLEKELGEDTRLGGWVEMEKSNLKRVRWAASMSGDPEDLCGWGVRLSGTLRSGNDRFQAESFVNLNMGKNFSLKPGLVYVVEKNNRFKAIMLRSSWSL